MKELSIEEKAKRYDEALERAKAMIKVAANQDEAIGFANTIFPELKESEDERIRKAIVATIHLYYGEYLEDEAKEMIDWIEKQEQKPTDEEIKTLLRTEYEKGRADAIAEMQKPAWSEEDDTKIKSIITFLKSPSLCAMDGNKGIIDENIKYLKSLKGKVQPKQEWSEEDIRNIENIDSVLFYDKDLPEDTCMRLRNWLKSLKPQNRWKPSEKQMEALKNAIHIKPYENPSDSLLWGLYEQLKTLKEY